MPRDLDQALLQLDNYPHKYSMDAQFGDMDVLGHVNNLAVGRFYESARARMHREIFGAKQYDDDNPKKIVLVENTTTFLDEAHYPNAVTVGSGIFKVGNSSYIVKQALFQKGNCIGLCKATLVCLVDGRPSPLDKKDREILNSFALSS